MKVRIHRGTNQIGGCITEIESNCGTRIIIDIGENLPKPNGEVSPEIEVEGLTTEPARYKAVFITHYHGDHIGLYSKVLKEIDIYTGKITKEIFSILQNRLSVFDKVTKEEIEIVKRFKTFSIRESKQINDIKITPIAVDHSAFDAYMFLIECDGKKLLHTGDFRTHGQRGKDVIPAIEKYVGKVDCLICEGTMLSRQDEKILTEYQLQRKAEKYFKENKYNFVFCSSTNIDRIAAIHKAAINTNKMFICDEYQKDILEYINSVSRSDLYKFNDEKNIKKTKVYYYDKNLLDTMKKRGFVMLVRANKLSRYVLKMFPQNNFIYSQWLGYLDKDSKGYKEIQEFVPEEHFYLHTSGHATPKALKEVIDVTDAKVVIPIHTERKEEITKLTNRALLLEDNEEYVVV